MIPDKNTSSENFTGILSINDLNGDFINGYRLKNGLFKTRFIKRIKKKSTLQFRNPEPDCDENAAPDIFCDNELDEVIIGGSGSSSNYTITTPIPTGPSAYSYSFSSSSNSNYGGSSSNHQPANYNNYVNVFPCNDSVHGCQKTPCDNGNGYQDYYGNCLEDDDKIINKLTNPCAKSIFTELESGLYKDHPLKPNVQIPNTSTSLNLSKIILNLFNNSKNIHLTIQNGETGDSNANTFGTTITIGNGYLSNATELSIARTMIHEGLHAYLNLLYSSPFSFISMSLRQKMDKYAEDNGYVIGTNNFHHNFMGKYIEAMAYSLYDWDKKDGTGGNLGWQYYKSMAYGGMFQVDSSGNIAIETDTFKKLVPKLNDRQKIANIVVNEQKNNDYAKGTKCD